MRTKKSEKSHGWLLIGSIAAIAFTAALYASLILNWLTKASPMPAEAPKEERTPASRADDAGLELARRAYRDDFLDPASWLSLSEALYRAGRPIDAFYVSFEAREFFGDPAYFEAHSRVVLGKAAEEAVPSPEEIEEGLSTRPQDARLLLAKARNAAVGDPMTAIPLFARAVHAEPGGRDAQSALDRLTELASGSEEGARGEISRLGREALEELRKAHPGDPKIFSALAMTYWNRGDQATARAIALEATRKNPNFAAAFRIEGLLALQAGDEQTALLKFTSAWERDAEDLLSAEKLALIYSHHRSDDDAAIPFLIALHRRDPRRTHSGEPVDVAIRRALDKRRQALAGSAPAEALGRFLGSDDASVRAEACARVGAVEAAQYLEQVANLLDDDVDLVRRNADFAVFRLASVHQAAVRARLEDWLGENRPLKTVRLINIFAELAPNETFPLALRALDDSRPAVRYLAKTLVIDRYYSHLPAGQRAISQYMSHEKDKQVLALYRGAKPLGPDGK